MAGELRVNQGKAETVSNGKADYLCYAIKTPVVTKDDVLEDVMTQHVAPLAQPGDIVFVSEKMVACTQGRAIPLKEIKPGFWARTLSKYVVKTPTGIGLGMPETMQCAINECGLPRILLAAGVGAVGKLFRQKGWFYHVAGRRAAAIDGPCHWTLPPYNEYVVLSPLNPSGEAQRMSKVLDDSIVLVVDINDLGAEILGSSQNLQQAEEDFLPLLRQNPLGQSDESTPVGILRPLK